jgi:transcription elongation factor Elf1
MTTIEQIEQQEKQDLIIASEAGFAAEAGKAELPEIDAQRIDPVLAARLRAMTDEEFSAYVQERCKPVIEAVAPVVDPIADVILEYYKCPKCHESRIDWLSQLDDDTYRCESCGLNFRPEYPEWDSTVVVDDGRVQPKWACPNCHESHTDMLAVDLDAEEMTCESCGVHYEIEVAEPVVEVDEDDLWREDQRTEKAMIEGTF